MDTSQLILEILLVLAIGEVALFAAGWRYWQEGKALYEHVRNHKAEATLPTGSFRQVTNPDGTVSLVPATDDSETDSPEAFESWLMNQPAPSSIRR